MEKGEKKKYQITIPKEVVAVMRALRGMAKEEDEEWEKRGERK